MDIQKEAEQLLGKLTPQFLDIKDQYQFEWDSDIKTILQSYKEICKAQREEDANEVIYLNCPLQDVTWDALQNHIRSTPLLTDPIK